VARASVGAQGQNSNIAAGILEKREVVFAEADDEETLDLPLGQPTNDDAVCFETFSITSKVLLATQEPKEPVTLWGRIFGDSPGDERSSSEVEKTAGAVVNDAIGTHVWHFLRGIHAVSYAGVSSGRQHGSETLVAKAEVAQESQTFFGRLFNSAGFFPKPASRSLASFARTGVTSR